MRKLLPLLLLCVLAGIAAIGFLARTPGPEQTGNTASEREAPAPAAPSAPLEPELAAQPGAAAPREALPEQAQTPRDPTSARLELHFTGRDSKKPLAKVRAMLFPVEPDPSLRGVRSVAGTHGDLEQGPLTGDEGIVDFDLPPGRALRLSTRSEDERCAGGSFEIAPLVPGEARTLAFELADGLDGEVSGRVVDAESAEPIAGAHVRLEAQKSSVSMSKDGQLESDPGIPLGEFETGNDGAFRLAARTWSPLVLHVDAPGYGPRLVSLHAEPAGSTAARVVRLRAAATLRGHLTGASGAAIAGAMVELRAHGYEMALDPDAPEYGPHGLVIPPDPSWRAETGADGRVEIAGLPSGVRLALEITREGNTLRSEPTGLKLEPAEVRVVEWKLGSGTLVRGLVTDQEGQPAQDLEIWLVRGESPARHVFSHYEGSEATAHTRTDAQGRYAFADVSAGSWLVGPAGVDSYATRQGEITPAGIAEPLLVDGQISIDLDLHVQRGLVIRGRVVGPDGSAGAGASVSAHSEDFVQFAQGHCSPNGNFVIGPLVPGTFLLSASQTQKFAGSEEFSVQAGEQDVVLRLRPGGALRGKVVDAVSGNACAAELVFTPPQHVPSDPAGVMWTSTGADGTFRFAGLVPGDWLVLASTSDGRFAQARGEVVAGNDGVEVVLSLSPGGKLQVGYAGEKQAAFASLVWNGGLVQFGTKLERGKSTEILAPAGRLLLLVRSDASKPARERTLDLGPGESKEIALSDED